MYQLIEKLHTLYELLQDEQSKEIFQARLAFDMEPSISNVNRLASSVNLKENEPRLQKEVLKKLNQEHKKIILYGTGNTGKYYASLLRWEGIDFYGFCGQRAKMRFPYGLMGKPVLTPDELAAHGDEYYVILAVSRRESYTEISKFLQEHNYPEDHILDWVDQTTFKQYFEFPALYRPGTAFIDGGCFLCDSSYQFAEWCGGAYSSIIAFEPDPEMYAECCRRIQNDPLPNFRLINAGLSNQEGTAMFDAMNNGASHVAIESYKFAFAPIHNQINNEISIHTVAIDDIVGDSTVGFIKMDIEGAEFDALHGAKNTILRDKPLLAICVYHLRGDVFAIMDYLHQLLPEYRFLLRHYSDSWSETVLYASVDL